LTENFTTIPIVTQDAYDYEWLEHQKEHEVTHVG
jgi:cytochrome c oxidase subunit 1